MSLFAIGDLHLSFSVNKPMDIFGTVWKNHSEKLQRSFSELSDSDTVVLCGDLSWGMNLEESVADFAFIHSLPGKKIILKGNHDYWWTTASNSSPMGTMPSAAHAAGFMRRKPALPMIKNFWIARSFVFKPPCPLPVTGKKSSFFTILPSQKPITVKKFSLS